MANSSSPVSAVSGQNKILLALAVLMLVVGYAAGSMLGGGKGLVGSCNDKAVRAELTKKLTASGLIPAAMPVTSLSGRITAIDENRLTLEVSNQNRNPLEAETPKVRVVTVADGVVIKTLKAIDPEEFQAAQKAFDKKQAEFMAALNKGENVMPPTPPTGFSEVEVKLSDVKVGMTATVTAAEDIMNAASFVATSVQVTETSGDAAGAPGMAPAPSPVIPMVPPVAPPAAVNGTGTVPMPTPAPTPAP